MVDIPAETINVEKHIMSTASQDIRDFIQPLEKAFGIKNFSYKKLFRGKKDIFLTTCPHIAEVYYHKKFYKNMFIDEIDKFHSGCFLMKQLESNKWVDIVKNQFGLADGLLIVNKHDDFVEFISFATLAKNDQTDYLYLNNIDVFKKFGAYFTDKAKKIIARAEQDKIIYPQNLKDDTLLTSTDVGQAQKEADALQVLLDASLDELDSKRDNYSYVTDNLTKREKECAYYLARGMTAKEIAKVLDISHRTVECYLASIKDKLNCCFKSEVINKILDSDLYSQYQYGPYVPDAMLC